MTLPTFIVFGTRKAGTSSLYHYLDQHPEVYMSTLKGTRFFLYDPENPEAGKKLPVKSLVDFKSYFAGAEKINAKAVGEVSPSYLSSRQAALRIKATIPNVRLIASLRNPVDRMYSQYQMDMRLRSEKDRVPLTMDNVSNWFNAGLYGEHLKNYYNIFDPEQIKILVFEDWIRNPVAMLRELYQFINVSEEFVPDMKTQYNKGGAPKNERIASLLKHRDFYIGLKPYVPNIVRSNINRVRNMNMRKAPPLEPEMRRHLQELYSDDIELLQNVIHKDLSIWKKA